ncbi:IS1 family transposase [Candidatus Woesearchaeota archaeon]|nr:IS1 family transposase [archaeon]MBT5022007.1 IS1 family transposase [Candidatus Woesearchaeota archaeon]
MHKHRKKIGRKRFFTKTVKESTERRQVCSICQAESLAIDKTGHSICKNCERTYKQIGIKCPTCKSINYEKKGFRNQKQRYVCKGCGRNWTSNGVVKNLVSREPKTKDTFQRENTLEEIIDYLKKQETNNLPLKFWYRNDSEPREMHDYFIDQKYVQVRADKGYYIKFLIDKIRKI